MISKKVRLADHWWNYNKNVVGCAGGMIFAGGMIREAYYIGIIGLLLMIISCIYMEESK
jgi:hypothetical protein